MDILIRKAILNDYEELCLIYKEIDELHRLNHPELFIEANDYSRAKEYISEIINDDSKALFVAETESKIVGFAECLILKSSSFPVIKKREWLQLDNIAVKRDYQNQNIGTMLFNIIIKWGRDQGINRIELKVYSFNTNAISFYKKNGFKDLNRTMYLNLES
ncbi:MAG: GNAT family N-acetyltransferase [Gudongella sp.]|nr:GNAT family N-acetyltransferase [Gudongella sp.]